MFLVTSDAQGKTDVTIDISGYKLDPEKLYRFEFTLTPSGNSEKHYTAYIDLKICTVYPFSPATPRLFTFAYISHLFTASRVFTPVTNQYTRESSVLQEFTI